MGTVKISLIFTLKMILKQEEKVNRSGSGVLFDNQHPQADKFFGMSVSRL